MPRESKTSKTSNTPFVATHLLYFSPASSSSSAMYENLVPAEKSQKHNLFVRYWYIFISFLGSLTFVNTLVIGAIVGHIRDKIVGREKHNVPQPDDSTYVPREAYPDLENMKFSKDLRYYAVALGLELEGHSITTEDGFILTLYNLYDPKVPVTERHRRRPILLQHGLLSHSGAFLTSGRNSLAYYFVEQGFDVWLGNNRLGFEAKHAHYKGNLMHNEQYWDWDILELAYYDLPCIIENVLAHKPNHEKLVLVGHLQGCTQSFLMLKNGSRADVHRKVEFFVLLAPAIFPGKLFHNKAFIKFIHHRSRVGFKLFYGCCSFLRNLGLTRNLLYRYSFFGTISYATFKYLFGWTRKKWGRHKKVWQFHLIFNLTYVSTKLMTWWLSEWVAEGFSNQLQPAEAYENGDHCAFTPVNSDAETFEKKPAASDDSKTYFSYKQLWFGFNRPEEVVPMLIFTGDLDYLVDGKRLLSHMRHYENDSYKEGDNLHIVELDDYSHLDVVWAEDAIGRIGSVVMKKLEVLEAKANRDVVTEKKDAVEDGSATDEVVSETVDEKIAV